MRRAWIGLAVVALLVLAVEAAGQTISKITVSGSEVNNGVVIVQIQLGAKPFTLQCNQGMMSCRNLKKGDYTMVELPKNFGIYECRDVEVYPESPQPAKDTKLGEYCLAEK
jgi:hypothetical protein